MKKSLFFLASAALVLASCENDQLLDKNTGLTDANQPQEIAFKTLVKTPKRAAVDGTTFPTGLAMKVTAYNATAGANYFAATTFNKGDGSTWVGGKYWPLTPATINFLAIANANADNETGVVWGPSSTNPTQKVTIALGDNKTNQYDLLYACGTGTVTQTSNVLAFPTEVSMQFKHAQAWVKFTVKAGDSETASALAINSITLNSVSCQGTYTVTHTNWDQTKVARDADASKNGSVAGAWSAYDTYAGNVVAVKAAGYTALSTSVQDYGSLMVVPDQGMASFTINYTVDGNTYNYTYTPASTTLAEAYKYTYNITLTLHKIEIAPTVANWTEGGPTAVSI